mmetsp:Transcript_133027/g.331975  ORF Transcript_133027/g.331975 Transcript_133027/m.331975 type:complete len:251 (-) Transcript_133027:2619-3371(-)
MFSVGLFMWCSSVSSSEMLSVGALDRISCWNAAVTSSISNCITAGRKSRMCLRSNKSNTGTNRRGFCVMLYKRVTASPYSFDSPSLPWLVCTRICKTLMIRRSVSGEAFCTKTSNSGSDAGMYLRASSMELTRCSFISWSHFVNVSTNSCSNTGRLIQSARYSQTRSLAAQIIALNNSPRNCSTRKGTFKGNANSADFGAIDRNIIVATSSTHRPRSFCKGTKSSSEISQPAPASSKPSPSSCFASSSSK